MLTLKRLNQQFGLRINTSFFMEMIATFSGQDKQMAHATSTGVLLSPLSISGVWRAVPESAKPVVEQKELLSQLPMPLSIELPANLRREIEYLRQLLSDLNKFTSQLEANK